MTDTSRNPGVEPVDVDSVLAEKNLVAVVAESSSVAAAEDKSTTPPAVKSEQTIQPALHRATAISHVDTKVSKTKQLLLLGAGHAHLAVLEKLARKRGLGAEVTLVSPAREVFYAGMLPGFVAGHYPLARCMIALDPLVARSRVDLIVGSVVHIDPTQRTVKIAQPDGNDRELSYDVLSVDTGASMEPEQMELLIPGSKLHAMFVRPVETFAANWQQLCSTAAERVMRIALVGAGAGGVELALAIRHRLPTCELTLFSGGREPTPRHARGVQRRVTKALERAGVALVRRSCITISPEALLLDDGSLHACDAVILANGARPPGWLDGSELALDERGFIAVDANLRSTSDPHVFAAGDVASGPDHPRPKSGVQAVRQAPILADNLITALSSTPGRLHKYNAPSQTLNLISCGNKYAIASWGALNFEGRWVWRWKDRIDRGYVKRFDKRQVPVG